MGKALRQDQLKYGWIRGGTTSVPLPMGASEVISAQSGRFVTVDSSGYGEISGAASTTIFGSVELGAQTLSATEGATTANCIIDPTAVFRIPVNSGTYAITMVGKTCDLSVSSNIQGAALDASDRDIVLIVGGDATNNNYVDVMIVPAKQIKAGVA